MRTEIVVPFTFDTSPIEEKLQAVGLNEVREKVDEIIEKHVKRCLPEPRYTRGYDEAGWSEYLKDCMFTWLDMRSEEIIDEAALLLAQRGSRRKAWREVLDEVKSGEER